MRTCVVTPQGKIKEEKTWQKKLSIGSWAYAFGPYEDNPVPFDDVVKRLSELEFDGVEIGAFKPHIDINDYPMKSDRDAVKGLISYYGLEVSGLAADFWSHPGPATDEAQEDDKYFKLFKENLQLALDLGSPAIRVDTVNDPEEGIPGVEWEKAWDRIVFCLGDVVPKLRKTMAC